MKRKPGYIFWIMVLAFVFMSLVLATQYLTRKNLSLLHQGNGNAVITFTINNRLQELVNISFQLNSKISRLSEKSDYVNRLSDSLTILGYNASVLSHFNMNSEAKKYFTTLQNLINRQIDISSGALNSNGNDRISLINRLKNEHISDSIYSTALSIQQSLEKELQKTLDNNVLVSQKLYHQNKILAIIAILAVLILGTIIINRHFKQLLLIKELERTTAESQKNALVKEQFLANMSHEIRTPLNAIKGFSELMKNTKLDNDQKQYLSIINEATKNLLVIVNDILDIAKIEAGKLSINNRQFLLADVVKTLHNIHINDAIKKRISLKIELDPDLPKILHGDPDRLLQILTNLLGNGIKFTQKGSVSLNISIDKQVENVFYLLFKVADTGTGIHADKINIIFKRFEQLNNARENAAGGTGLGLSIVESLVNLMHGSIYVESEIGIGSVFNITIPFQTTSGPLTGFESKPQEIISSKIDNQAKILIVDDNRVNQLLLQKLLLRSGIDFDVADNGLQALEMVQQGNYDLILLDIQMPEMDGYTTIHELRNKLGFSKPVIAMTAYAYPGEKEKCIAAGMNDYISKPVDAELLSVLIRNYFEKPMVPDRLISVSYKNETDYLLELSGGDIQMASLIKNEILKEVSGIIQKLQQYNNEKNYSSMAELCHSMISTFGPLGNEEINRLILALQQKVKENPADNLIISSIIDYLILNMNKLTQTRD